MKASQLLKTLPCDAPTRQRDERRRDDRATHEGEPMEQILGIILLSLGGLSSASFYVPSHKIKKWSWETYWITLGFVAWIIMPTVGGLLTTPDLCGHSPRQQRRQPARGLRVRRPVGFWRADVRTGPAIPRPLARAVDFAGRLRDRRHAGSRHARPQARPVGLHRSGRAVSSCWDSSCAWPASPCAAMRACSRSNGSRTSRRRQSIKDFALAKGLTVAVFGGIMSASMALAFTAGKPIAAAAVEAGTPRRSSRTCRSWSWPWPAGLPPTSSPR